MPKIRVPSTTYKGVYSKDGGKTWCGQINVTLDFPLKIKKTYPSKKIHTPACPSEEMAALRRAIIMHKIFGDMSHVDPPALSLLQQALPSLPTGVSIQEQLDEWKEANLTFSKGEAGLRGVYKQGSNGFRAQIRHPVTKNQVTLLSSTAPNARELCARAYDRTVLRWFGSAAVTNYNWSEYVNDDGPDVRKAAEATGRHEHIKGKYSGHRYNNVIQRNHSLKSTSLVDPSTSTTVPVATPVEAAAMMAAAAAESGFDFTTATGNDHSRPISACTEYELADEGADYFDDSESEFESEYETEPEDGVSYPRHSYTLLSAEQEVHVLDWLKENGIEFPFTDDQNEEDYDIDDDPYGVFAHLAGPNWHIPPTHTTAYHLWKSEVNRALSRFESDSFKILDILDAQNDTDPESFKVNGTYPAQFKRWLIVNNYIDEDENVLGWIPFHTHRDKNKTTKRAAPDAIPVPTVLAPPGTVPSIPAPYIAPVPHPDAFLEVEGFNLYPPPNDYYSATLEPGIEKFLMPRGWLGLTDHTNYHARAAHVANERKIKKWESDSSFLGPDGHLSLELIRKSYHDLGEEFSTTIAHLHSQPEFRDWFIVNASALRKFCKEPELDFLSEEQFKQQKQQTEPQRAIAALQQGGPVGGTAADWNALAQLTAQLQAKLAGKKYSEVTLSAAATAAAEYGDGTTPSHFSAPAPAPVATAASQARSPAEIESLIKEKMRKITPQQLASARAAIATLVATQQQLGAADAAGSTVPPPSPFPATQFSYSERQDKICPPGATPPPPPFIFKAGEPEFFEASQCTTNPTLPSHLPQYFTPIIDDDDEEEEEGGNGDFVSRWDAVAPGLAHHVSMATDGAASWEVVDDALAARMESIESEAAHALARCNEVEASIDATLAAKDRLTRIDGWNWKVGLAVQQQDVLWLRDILGEDWETIIAAHPDCKVFGDHPLLPPPDVHDPLQLMGVYDDDLNFYFPQPWTYDQMARIAFDRIQGAGGDLILDAVSRYWGPVLNDPCISRHVPIPGNVFRRTAEEIQPAAVNVTADDEAFVQDLIEQKQRAGKRRRKDTYYL